MTDVRWPLADGTSVVVEARFGKVLDVVALKQTDLDGVAAGARELAAIAATLYEGATAVGECPMCCAAAADAEEGAVVFGVPYRVCARCGHAFVGVRPAPEALARRFAESEQLAAPYTDLRSLEVRMEQVVRPKLAWALDTFEQHRGSAPRSAVDVGAGGGHFVAAARAAGIDARGYELSEASRRFAKEAFDLELDAGDFLATSRRSDLVTFWGLLEYTPEPRRFLEAARSAVADDGMLVVEVPRFECLGSVVQQKFPETVARHLDPTSHVNVFSDCGLATALVEAGFRPVAAWYFGMDAYELAVQLALRLGEAQPDALMASLLPLQEALDRARFCDDVVVAALPVG